METNLEKLNKKLKIFKIIRLTCIILFLPLLLLIGITAPQNTALATIITVLEIIVIITGLILDKKTKELKTLIYNITIVKTGIEDSKK